MKKTLKFLDERKAKSLEELKDLLSYQSVSTDKVYTAFVRECADYIKNDLEQSNVQLVKIYETAGHPIVYAQHIIDENLPTVLFYGHYDVQPADPIEKWDTKPFEPVVKVTDIHPEGAIFARGAADDKGQIHMFMKALQAMIATGELPCNVKVILEGEEEIGSVNLEGFCEEYKDMLSADGVLVCDTSIISNTTPSIPVSLRGLSYMEVKVTGPNKDLHSGVYGGPVVNPLNTLCQMIASLHDEYGKVTIEGFYDNVLELTADEREKYNEAPFDEDVYMEGLSVNALGGEMDYTPMERASIRPTLDVNGMWGGYTGEGAKTVLPSEGYAKISMRLVGNQTPEEIDEKFTKHFKSIAPAGVTVEVESLHGGYPYFTTTETLLYKAGEMALTESFGVKPYAVTRGGSIPVTATFKKVLGLDTLLMGFSLNSDVIHSPNEHYGLFNYYKGMETIPLFFANFAKLQNG